MNEIPEGGSDIDNGAQAERRIPKLETQCKVQSRGIVRSMVLYVININVI